MKNALLAVTAALLLGACFEGSNGNDRRAATPVADDTRHTLGTVRFGAGRITGEGIDCGTDCSETFAQGRSVTLTATAEAGSRFAGWGGACSGLGACTVTMSQNQAVSALFETAGSYKLSATTLGGGGIASSPAGIDCGNDCCEDYTDGTVVALTATPAAGQRFAGCSRRCPSTASTSARRGRAVWCPISQASTAAPIAARTTPTAAPSHSPPPRSTASALPAGAARAAA